MHAGVFLSAVYGGYFGAGLGIMLLAALGAFLPDDMQRLNALKGLLSLVISAAAVVYFALFGAGRVGGRRGHGGDQPRRRAARRADRRGG